MDNYTIAQVIDLYAKLLDLHAGNDFKIKALAAAAFSLKKLQDPLAEMPPSQWINVRGIGKSVVTNITEIIETGHLQALNELVAATPAGVVQMMRIKGLGAKKVRVLWKDMQMQSIDELYNACRENRLIEVKGFGSKTQAQIMGNIEFMLAAQGKYHYARVAPFVQEIVNQLQSELAGEKIAIVGQLSLQLDTIELAEVQCSVEETEIAEIMEKMGFENNENGHFFHTEQLAIPISFKSSNHTDWERHLFENQSTEAHRTKINYQASTFETAKLLYSQMGINYIPAAMRHGHYELDWAKKYNESDLITYPQLQGSIHNHTVYSDGVNTVAQMAQYCMHKNWQYLAICDHSQSAFYANGLKPETVLTQWAEIDAWNTKNQGFKTYKGIESDILNNGNLDYENDILAGFDLVVASVHSNLKMDKHTATQRLLTAIENPYTRILGHPTGRLLLMREGYELDFEKIIDACAANNVAIEINAHPYRLDLDWKWIYYAMEKNVWLSINPDAHETAGFEDMYWGVLAAQKGGLISQKCLNALDLIQFEKWLDSK